jgi:hypothetical protein
MQTYKVKSLIVLYSERKNTKCVVASIFLFSNLIRQIEIFRIRKFLIEIYF